MLDGDFELSLANGTSLERLPEVEAADGKTYCVAAPGSTFKPFLKVHNMPAGVTYKARLTLDGRYVNYNKIIKTSDAGYRNYWPGWLTRGDCTSCSYLDFTFAKPVADSSKPVTGLNFAEGKLVCEVWQAVAGEPWPKGTGAGATIGTVTSATVAALPEGKKFFLAPSLTAGAGAASTGHGFVSTSYTQVGTGPVATLELRYETAATLMLRGILKQSNPDHRAVIDMFEDTRREAEAEDAAQREEQERAEAERARRHRERADREAAAAAAMAVKVKQEGAAGIKQEGAQRRVKQGRGEENIDLTAPNWRRQVDPILLAMKDNNVLVCDLTDDGEAPNWRASKKLRGL